MRRRTHHRWRLTPPSGPLGGSPSIVERQHIEAIMRSEFWVKPFLPTRQKNDWQVSSNFGFNKTRVLAEGLAGSPIVGWCGRFIFFVVPRQFSLSPTLPSGGTKASWPSYKQPSPKRSKIAHENTRSDCIIQSCLHIFSLKNGEAVVDRRRGVELHVTGVACKRHHLRQRQLWLSKPCFECCHCKAVNISIRHVPHHSNHSRTASHLKERLLAVRLSTCGLSQKGGECYQIAESRRGSLPEAWSSRRASHKHSNTRSFNIYEASSSA